MTYSEFDLYRIIRDYGEDKFAKNIAKHIVMRDVQKSQSRQHLNSSDVIKACDTDEDAGVTEDILQKGHFRQ